ncbi:hypothetical protein ACOMHN_029780 [Nucella lapillus]
MAGQRTAVRCMPLSPLFLGVFLTVMLFGDGHSTPTTDEQPSSSAQASHQLSTGRRLSVKRSTDEETVSQTKGEDFGRTKRNGQKVSF